LFRLELKGPWKQLKYLLGGYDRRLKYVEQRIGADLAQAFLEKIKEGAPSEPEYQKYIKSLAVVELTGTRGRVVFAVISDRTRVKLGEAIGDGLLGKTVVYIYPSTGEVVSDVVELLEAGNPWPADMVPHGVPKNDVSLIHRVVTEGEVKWARQNAMEVVSENREVFRRYGVYWGKAMVPEDHADELESLPDFMSLAVRAEFGINAAPMPHWRPAAKWVLDNAVEILKKDEKIKLALHDSLFREHTIQKSSGFPTMKAGDFTKEAGEFEKKVVNG
jgi:hypothetical protein